MRVLVVDNYDSFVFNLVQYLGQLGVHAQVWRNDDDRLATDAELAPVARAMARAEASGAAPAETVARVADECREAYEAAATAAARAVGVRATVPLGVCFLPAFLLIGVVPVVAGLGGALMAG